MTPSFKKKDLIKPTRDKLTEMTVAFCKQALDKEYEELCRRMIDKMARKRLVSFLSGRLELWAASVIYAIGSFNFLQDKSFKPYVSTDEIADFFGVSNGTMRQKAAQIKKMFKMGNPFFDFEFATQRIIKNSPFKNFAVAQDGFVIPLPDDMLHLFK